MEQPSIDIHYSWSAYLKRCVINTSLNYLERNRRHPHVDLEALTVHPTVSPADQHQTFSELTNQVDDAIQNLPVRTRTVFVLIRQEEMSYKEVGESLQISTKAVEKEMMKALRRLRQNLRNFLPSLIWSAYRLKIDHPFSEMKIIRGVGGGRCHSHCLINKYTHMKKIIKISAMFCILCAMLSCESNSISPALPSDYFVLSEGAETTADLPCSAFEYEQISCSICG